LLFNALEELQVKIIFVCSLTKERVWYRS